MNSKDYHIVQVYDWEYKTIRFNGKLPISVNVSKCIERDNSYWLVNIEIMVDGINYIVSKKYNYQWEARNFMKYFDEISAKKFIKKFKKYMEVKGLPLF